MSAKNMFNGTASLFWLMIKNNVTFRSDMIMNLLTRLGFPFIAIVAWIAIYASTSSSSVGQFTLSNMISYYLVLTVVEIVLWYTNAIWIVQDDVQSGFIVTKLIRPANYPISVFAEGFGNLAFYFVLIGIPLLIAITYLTGLSVSLTTLLLFIASLLIALVIAFAFQFIIGTLAIYFTNIGGMAAVYFTFEYLIGGGLFPLTLLPSSIGSIFMSSPFAFQLYFPAMLYSGGITLQFAMQQIWIGVAWAVIITAVAALLWKVAKRRVDAVGV